MNEKTRNIEFVIPKEILNEIKDKTNKFYLYFRYHKESNLMCLIFLNKNISKDQERIFEEKYLEIKISKNKSVFGNYSESVTLEKNSIFVTWEIFFKIKEKMELNSEIKYFYDREIDSIILFNSKSFEEYKNLIEK